MYFMNKRIVLKAASLMYELTFLFMFLALINSCKSKQDKKEVKSLLKSKGNETSRVKDTTPKNINSYYTNTGSIEKKNSDIICTSPNIQKISVSRQDSSISLIANIKFSYRIFGYEKPDINSKKKILFSIFTDEVENNIFKCEFGSYYQTSDIMNFSLKFIAQQGAFIKLKIFNNSKETVFIYILKKWVEFDD